MHYKKNGFRKNKASHPRFSQQSKQENSERIEFSSAKSMPKVRQFVHKTFSGKKFSAKIPSIKPLSPSFKKNDLPKSKNPKSKLSKSGAKKTNLLDSKALFPMPLNKFLAKTGITDRRKAVDLIKAGNIRVNDLLICNPAHRVFAKDKVSYKGKVLQYKRDFVYILLNKPKDCLSTTQDPQGRKTVIDIIGRACDAKIYPVGRLDRNTTGLLLLTNDGELAQQLTHPKFQVRKVYEVSLDKPLTPQHYTACLSGIVLEDGAANFDALAYLDTSKRNLGIEIHSGRNRIIRRVFEQLGYKIKTLDRVLFAGLTKKNLPRGQYRSLSPSELRNLYKTRNI